MWVTRNNWLSCVHTVGHGQPRRPNTTFWQHVPAVHPLLACLRKFGWIWCWCPNFSWQLVTDLCSWTSSTAWWQATCVARTWLVTKSALTLQRRLQWRRHGGRGRWAGGCVPPLSQGLVFGFIQIRQEVGKEGWGYHSAAAALQFVAVFPFSTCHSCWNFTCVWRL